MAEEYVTICDVCSKGITKQDLKFANGHTFHNECFVKKGKEFPAPDYKLQSNTTQAKLDLIHLKNLKHRLIGGSSKGTKSLKRKKSRKSTRKATAKRRTARKSTRKATAKRRTARKSTRRR